MAENKILSLTVDTKSAKVNLTALAEAIADVSSRAREMKNAIGGSLDNLDKSVGKMAAATTKLTASVETMSKVKLNAELSARLTKFAAAMDAVANTKTISKAKVTNFTDFVDALRRVNLGEQGAQLKEFAKAMNTVASAKTISKAKADNLLLFAQALSRLKMPVGLGAGIGDLNKFSQAMASLRVPSEAQIARLQKFMLAMDEVSGTKTMSGAAVRSIGAMANALAALNNFNPPSAAKIERLKLLANTLAGMKAIPNAAVIARDLAVVGSAAQKASNGFSGLPPRILRSGDAARKSSGAFVRLGGDLSGLTARFSLARQGGSLFSTVFSAFTLGTFVKKLYDANIQLLVLQKGLVFSTGSFKGAEEATDKFIGMAIKLGIALDGATKNYSAFSISAKAAGLSNEESFNIFKAFSVALTVAGADSEKMHLAFYALQEMLQKGKVTSKEFLRQLGQQIPGLAVAGAAALSKMKGSFVSIAEFYQEMAKGKLLSPKFVPELAAQLKTMFDPLQDLATKRPDAVIRSLGDAFFVFAREVGKGGFMGALTADLTKLRDAIVLVDKDGVAHLTPAAQALANSIGKNLANLVHALSVGLIFMAHNLKTVVEVAKDFLLVLAAMTFIDFIKGANGAATSVLGLAGSIGKLIKSLVTLEAVQKGMSFLDAKTAGKNVEGAAANIAKNDALATGEGVAGGVVAGSFLKRAFIPEAISSAGKAKKMASGANAAKWASGAANVEVAGAGEAVAVDAAYAATAFPAMTTAMTGATVAVGAFSAAAAGISAFLIGIATAAAITASAIAAMGLVFVGALGYLALFGNAVTHVGGESVRFKDVLKGILGELTVHFKNFFNGTHSGFGELGNDWDKFQDQMGQDIVELITNLQHMLQLLTHIPKAIGIAMKAHKDRNDPKKLFEDNAAMEALRFGDSRAAIRSQIITETLAAKQNRISTATAGASLNENGLTPEQQRTQDVLQQAQEARNIASAEGEAQDLARRINMGQSDVPNPADLLKAAHDNIQASTDAAKTLGEAGPALQAAATMLKEAAPKVAGVKNLPADVAEAVHRAGQYKGVDENYLANVAVMENPSFRPDARPINKKTGLPMSSALGQFQILEGTARDNGYGQGLGTVNDPRLDVFTSALIAANIAVKTNARGKAIIGRDLNPGELLTGQVMGEGASAEFLKAYKKDPNQDATKLFPTDAKQNPSLFFKNGKGMSLNDVLYTMNQKAGGATVGGRATADSGIVGPGLTGLSGPDADTALTRYDKLKIQYNSLIGQTNPAAGATSKYENDLLEIQKLMTLDAQWRELMPKGTKPLYSESQMADLIRRANDKRRDAVDPFSKDTRLAQEEGVVTAMRIAGLTDEAKQQDILNKMKEAGYDITRYETEANLKATVAIKDLNDLLSAQLGIVEDLNKAHLDRINRTGSPLDIAFAARIKPEQGERFQDAVASAEANKDKNGISQADFIRTGVGIERGSARLNIAQTAAENLSEQFINSQMSAPAAAIRDSYKNYLKELSGSTHESLIAIEADAAAMDKAIGGNTAQLAHDLAVLKDQAEHPPGFQKWVNGLDSVAHRLEDIKATFAEDISSAITDSLSGDKVDFSAMFAKMKKEGIKILVDNTMSGIIQKITGKAPGMDPKIAAEVAELEAQQQASRDAADAALKSGQAADVAKTAATTLTSAGEGLTDAATALGRAAVALGDPGPSSFGAGNPFTGGPPLDTSMFDTPNYASSGAFDNSPFSAFSGFLAPGTGPVGAGDIIDSGVGADELSGGAGNDIVNMADEITVMGQRNGGLGTLSPSPDFNVGDLMQPPSQSFGGSGGILGSIGSMLSKTGGTGAALLTTGLGAVLHNLFKRNSKDVLKGLPVNGVIGTTGAINTTGTEEAGHANPIAGILSLLANVAISAGMGNVMGPTAGAAGGSGGFFSNFLNGVEGSMGFGQAGASSMAGAGHGSSFFTDLIGKVMPGFGDPMAGLYREGGISGSAVQFGRVTTADYRNLPHYAEGTPNTSGDGMLSMLHPNEAVIPLSRGRSVPVEMRGDGNVTINSPIYVTTPDANSFRQSSAAIEKRQSTTLRRSSIRNLTGPTN